MSAQELSKAVDRLSRHVGHWEAPRWGVAAFGTEGTRAEVVHGLVQRMADRAADAEGLPPRQVPRLSVDTSLLDQLRVVSADLLAASPADEVLATAADDVRSVQGAL
jgi:hypothetical protein